MEEVSLGANVLNRIKSAFKKRAYRTEVLGGVMALLHDLQGEDTKIVLRAYPGIEDAIASNFEDGDITPNRAALDVTTIVITEMIETQLPEETRKNIIEQFDAANVFSDDEKEPFIQRFERIAWIAESWVKAGTLDKEDLDRTLHEIAGALKGVEAHEREKDRIMSALYRGLFPNLTEQDDEENDPQDQNEEEDDAGAQLVFQVKAACEIAENRLEDFLNTKDEYEREQYDRFKKRAVSKIKLIEDDFYHGMACHRLINLCIRAEEIDEAKQWLAQVRDEFVKDKILDEFAIIDGRRNREQR